jgi:hypothetical protein
VAIGAGLAALASGGDPLTALAGAFAGLSATGGHWVLKRSPLPYGDKPAGANDRVTPVLLVMLAAILMGGCHGTFDDRKALGAHERTLGMAPGSPERCVSLSNAEDNWQLAAKIGAGVGLAGALAPTHETVREDDRGRVASIAVAGVGALAAGVGAHMASVKGGRYVQEGCGR